MTVWLAVGAGCTTVYIPGWAAIGAVAVAAAPRAYLRYRDRGRD